MFRKSENQPSSQEVQEHAKTHIPYHSWCAHCVRGTGGEMISTGQEEEGEDQEIFAHLAIDHGFLKANNLDDPADQESNPILTGAEAKYELTLAMAVPGKGNAAPKCVADWFDYLGSQTVTFEVRQRASHSRFCPGDSEAEVRK